MDTLYTAILDALNGLIPSAMLADFANFNEILAYFITICLVYTVIFRPLFKMFRVVK